MGQGDTTTMHGMETVPMISTRVNKLDMTEMKMSRWTCSHTLSDHVRTDDIREILTVENIIERCMKARLRWIGHGKRREQEYVEEIKTLEIVGPTSWEKKRKTEAEMDGAATRRRGSIGVGGEDILNEHW